MKIRNILLALTLVVVPSAAQAQVCADSPCVRVMNITGTVESNVSATIQSSMSFGAIGATLQTADGQFQVTSNQSVGVGIVVTNLTNIDGDIITLGAECRVGATFATGAAFNNAPCAGETLGIGTNNIWIRGSITAGAGAAVGNYSGTATLTVTYASF